MRKSSTARTFLFQETVKKNIRSKLKLRKQYYKLYKDKLNTKNTFEMNCAAIFTLYSKFRKKARRKSVE